MKVLKSDVVRIVKEDKEFPNRFFIASNINPFPQQKWIAKIQKWERMTSLCKSRYMELNASQLEELAQMMHQENEEVSASFTVTLEGKCAPTSPNCGGESQTTKEQP